MNLDVFLSLFSLMLISLVVNVLAQKMRAPYTVLLVIAGSLLVPLSHVEFFSFITSFNLTPELLFFVFLPILIFESAYAIKVRDMLDNIRAISLLAIISLLVSTFFIGFCGYYLFQLLGIGVPLIVMLLFGAIISATDPVAVLALFKEYGAPKRLTLIFEGESLFNDGTAFATFLVFLDIMMHGYTGTASILNGLLDFTVSLFGGIIFGLSMGFLFSKIIELVKGREHLEITLTLLVAHFTFILSEVISEYIVIGGIPLRLSSIIATLMASLVMGNYGRYKMSSGVEEYMERFWSYFGFIVNSLVFLLMGLLFIEQSIALHVAILPIILAVLVVMTGRAVAIYPVLGFFNMAKKEQPIPLSWMHLLSWGGLRGSLAVVMVLLIPDDISLPGWNYAFSVKEFVTAITIGCIYFTLLVKAPSIGRVMKKLDIDALTDYEEQSYYKSKSLINHEIMTTLQQLFDEHMLSDRQLQLLTGRFQQQYESARNEYKKKRVDDQKINKCLLSIFVLGMEKADLKEMYRRGEINEKIYKKILTLLDIQMERVLHGCSQLNSLDEKFPVDSVDKFLNGVRRLFFLPSQEMQPEELYIYYRTEYQLLVNSVARLDGLTDTSLIEIFDDAKALAEITTLYKALVDNTKKNLDRMLAENDDLLAKFNANLVEKTIVAKELEALQYLSKNGIITDKLYIMLKNELLVE